MEGEARERVIIIMMMMVMIEVGRLTGGGIGRRRLVTLMAVERGSTRGGVDNLTSGCERTNERGVDNLKSQPEGVHNSNIVKPRLTFNKHL